MHISKKPAPSFVKLLPIYLHESGSQQTTCNFKNCHELRKLKLQCERKHTIKTHFFIYIYLPLLVQLVQNVNGKQTMKEQI